MSYCKEEQQLGLIQTYRASGFEWPSVLKYFDGDGKLLEMKRNTATAQQVCSIQMTSMKEITKYTLEQREDIELERLAVSNFTVLLQRKGGGEVPVLKRSRASFFMRYSETDERAENICCSYFKQWE